MKYLLKVIRNGLILAGLFFISIWAGRETLGFSEFKTLIIFFMGYILTEYANYYHLNNTVVPKKKQCLNTLIL